MKPNYLNKVLTEAVRLKTDSVLIKRFSSILGIDILVKASGFILLPVYLRLMSQEEYGLYNYFLSIISTFSIVLNFGLYVSQSKLYHDFDTHNRGKLLFTIYSSLLFLLTLILVPVYFLKIDFHLVRVLFKNPISYQKYRMVILLALVISVLSFMLTNFFYTSEKIKQVKNYNLSRIVFVNVFALIALYLVNKDAVETRLAYTYMTELLLFIVFSFLLIGALKFQFDVQIASLSIRLGWPIMLSAVFGIVINFSDKFFLEKYGNFKTLSTYYLAFSFASIIPVIFTSLQNVWLPIFFKEKDVRKNIEKTERLIYRLLIVLTSLSLFIWLLLKFILYFEIISPKYEQAIFILPILLATQIIASIATLFNNYMIYFGRTYIISIVGFFICLLSFGLSVLMVPRWGVYGAAFATLVSNSFYFATYYFMVKFYSKKESIQISSVTSQ